MDLASLITTTLNNEFIIAEDALNVRHTDHVYKVGHVDGMGAHARFLGDILTKIVQSNPHHGISLEKTKTDTETHYHLSGPAYAINSARRTIKAYFPKL